jgi:hypothetical protein
MTNQTASRNSLGGSPAGGTFFRLCTLTLAAILATGGAAAGFAQDKPEEPKPAKPSSEKKKKPAAAEPAEKISHGYLIHQSLEVGGRFTTVSGSTPMWDTLVNQTSGGRILGQSLEMHSVDPSKTPFFDTLTTSSTGYGGDPFDVSRFNISKGRIYDFAGSFRRDRNYFDYNLLDTSLLSTATAAAPVLVTENDSLHLFNTVRRNTDTTLTLLPLSRISFRAGYNHGTNEGPSFSSIHAGGDTQVSEWFRNASDTYTGGVDAKLAKRTTLSYDQFWVLYKGDSTFQLTGANYQLSNGTPISLGVNVLGGNTTCGSAANTTTHTPSTRGPEITNGIVWQYCSGTTAESSKAPTRTSFPSEQLRFSSHYWDKLSFNGRFLYSGGTNNVNNFNQTFTGFNSRTFVRQEIFTGGLANGRLANNKRISTNGDFGVVAELNKFLSITDSFNFVNLRTSGYSIMNEQLWTGVAGNTSTVPPVPATSQLTPLSDPTITVTTPSATNTEALNQKIAQNTVLAVVTAGPLVKLSGGWRYKSREITDPGDDLTWHENWVLLGAVFQPTHVVRINLNYDQMRSKSATSATESNTYTREAPNKALHFRARATVRPAKWINFAVASNTYSAKNDDPLVNHKEHNHDFSLGTSIMPMDGLSFDFSYAHDDVYSRTDLCYIFVGTATYPVPNPTTASTGTCLQTAANPTGTLPPPGTTVANQLYLGSGLYDAPTTFFSGSVNYAPSKYLHISAGERVNSTNGTAEQLNPLMVPGALQSTYVTPFADLEIHIASQWAWHGNWTHDGYHEHNEQGLLPSRNVYGDILTLGVKYAF